MKSLQNQVEEAKKSQANLATQGKRESQSFNSERISTDSEKEHKQEMETYDPADDSSWRDYDENRVEELLEKDPFSEKYSFRKA